MRVGRKSSSNIKYFIITVSVTIIIFGNMALAKGDNNYADYANNLRSNLEKSQKEDKYQQYLKDAQSISSANHDNIRTYRDNFGSTHQRAMAAIQSQKYQKQLSEFFPEANLSQLNDEYSGKSQRDFHQLMIFVSSSMPQNLLEQYSIQSRKAGGVLVLRGIINNSFQETVKFILALNRDGTRAIIDPYAFRNFHITQVPQIVVVKDGHNCKDGRCNGTPLHDKISGSISLGYALESISKKGKFAKEESIRFLETLRS